MKRLQQSAFTLLEVLVALAVLSLTYAVSMQILGGSAARAATVADYRRASMIAQSRLTEAASLITRDMQQRSGTVDGRFDWTTSAVPDTSYAIEGYASRFSAVVVTVTVEWSGGQADRQRVSLSTLRLVTGATP